jgi:hypothetical protein
VTQLLRTRSSTSITRELSFGAVVQGDIRTAMFDPGSMSDRAITRTGSDIADFADKSGILVVVSHVIGVSEEFASNVVPPKARTRLKVVARPAVRGKVIGAD